MKKHVYEICVGVILLIAVLACNFGSGGLPEPETDFRFAVLVVFPDQAIFKGEKIPGHYMIFVGLQTQAGLVL